MRVGVRAAVVQVVACWEASVSLGPERAAGARLSLAGDQTRPRASAQGRALPWPLRASSIWSVLAGPMAQVGAVSRVLRLVALPWDRRLNCKRAFK